MTTNKQHTLEHYNLICPHSKGSYKPSFPHLCAEHTLKSVFRRHTCQEDKGKVPKKLLNEDQHRQAAMCVFKCFVCVYTDPKHGQRE